MWRRSGDDLSSGARRSFLARDTQKSSERKERFTERGVSVADELAGRQGFELGAEPVSNVVMARDFWFQALESQAGYVGPFRSLPSTRFLAFLPASWRHSGDGSSDVPGPKRSRKQIRRSRIWLAVLTGAVLGFSISRLIAPARIMGSSNSMQI